MTQIQKEGDMDIIFKNQVDYKEAYGILCGSLPKRNLHQGLSPTFCQILKDGKTTPHDHFEPEIFFIIKGFGKMIIQNKDQLVSSGDLIQIPPFSNHQLINMGDETLEFLSVYSEDYEVPEIPKNVLLTVAPPTPNGPLHLGHISGPYLASDIVARYHKSQSVSLHSHCGTDDHQNYVHEKSINLGVPVDVFQKNTRNRILKGLNHLQIQFDDFIEPKSNHAYQFQVLNLVNRAVTKGVIQKEFISLPHCSNCDITLIDALVKGSCPHCLSPSSGGCENCGIVVPPHELLSPKCNRCGRSAQTKNIEVYTFNLGHYLPLIESDLNALPLSPKIRELVGKVQNLKEAKVLVSHPSNSQRGLKFPESDQNIHVWFEMAAQYESFSLGSSTWVHFFGFDNSFHYLLFIPSLLRALNSKTKLPNAVVTNEFLLLDGLKFSTSRDHAIWADEFAGNTDHLRFYLSYLRPSQQSSDFSLSEFQLFSQNLEKLLQTARQRAIHLSRETLPDLSSSVALECHRLKRDLDYLLSLNQLDIRQAARRIYQFLDHTVNSFGLPQDDFLRLQSLANHLAPFMPTEAARLLPEIWKDQVSGSPTNENEELGQRHSPGVTSV